MTSYWRAVGENLRLALDTLRTHKFRSFLTVLGVLIGTATVIAVASIIQGLDAQLVQMAEQYGTNVLWVYKLQMGTPHRLTREERLRKPLTYEDAQAIKEQCPNVEDVSVALFGQMGEFGLPPSTARYKGHEMPDAQFLGVDANYLALSNSSLADGRFYSGRRPSPPRRRRSRRQRSGTLVPKRGPGGQGHRSGRTHARSHRHA